MPDSALIDFDGQKLESRPGQFGDRLTAEVANACRDAGFPSEATVGTFLSFLVNKQLVHNDGLVFHNNDPVFNF